MKGYRGETRESDFPPERARIYLLGNPDEDRMPQRRRPRATSESRDRHLVDAARSILARRYRPQWHSVGAAVRGTSGRIYTAVNLNARYVGQVDVCAEAIAVGMAIAAGEKGLETIVAVQRGSRGSRSPRGRIVPPCGVCREMLNDYAPKAMVLLAGPRGNLVRRKAEDLLPDRYVDP